MMNDFLKKVNAQVNTTIAVDFDGVIHKNSKGFHDGTVYDEPLEGSIEALKNLSKEYTLVIFTCKANSQRPLINGKTGIELIWEWLVKYNIAEYISEVTDIKPRAKFYIDDKGIKFENWEQTLNDMKG